MALFDHASVLRSAGVDPIVAQRTLFFTIHGSHAYGTAIPSSDRDYRGVFLGERKHYLGFAHRVDQHERQGKKDGTPDVTVFELRKFFGLAADCNPNVVELLFVDESSFIHVDPRFRKVLENREKFLSRRARHTFSGYAMSQMRRIKGHHRWLRNPPKAQPTRADHGLPERTLIPKDQLQAAESAVRKKLGTWNLDGLGDLLPATIQEIKDGFEERLLELTLWSREDRDAKAWKAAAACIGIDANFIELLDRERRYGAALKDWKDYQGWLKDRNPDRAALEAKHGYDTKHMMHLVRLLREGIEILTTGTITVRRPDAEELIAIRHGAWSIEQGIAYAETMQEKLIEAEKTSKLPYSVDREALDELCMEIAADSLAP